MTIAARAAAAALVVSTAVPLAAQPAAPWSPADLERVVLEIAAALESSHVLGASVALVAQDTVWAAGVGRAGDAGPVTPTTLFRANSVTKSLVALAALRLAGRGQLALDQPLREAAPDVDVRNPWDDSHPVRVAHLLEHTTGFDDLRPREYALYPADGPLRDALALHPPTRTARWAPGTRTAYNNGAYAVAAVVLETASGVPFPEVVEREVLGPLGMRSSGVGIESVDRSRLTWHVLPSGEEEPPAPYPLLIRPAGGLVTSAADLARLVQALLTGTSSDGAPYLDDAALRRMRTPRTSDAARAGLRTGYGLGSYTAPAAGHLWHGHAGGTPSAFARYALQPELGVGYVLLMNGADADARRRVERALQRALVGGRPAPSPPAPARLDDPTAFEGLYRQTTATWQLTAGVERLLDVQRVRADGTTLTLAPVLGDLPDTLVAAGGDLFRPPDLAAPTVAFLRDGRGAVSTLQTWDAENLRAGTYERVSPLRVYAPLVALPLALLLIASALLVGLVRAAAALAGRRARDGRWVRWLPTLASAAFVAAVFSLAVGLSGDGDLADVLGRPTGTAVGFWALSWLFGALSVGALVVTVHALVRRPDLARLARGHAFAVALACGVWTATLASWGLLGVRTWAF